MDRAERLFEELSASREYRNAALEHLLRIYEQQMDWPNALKVFHELPRVRAGGAQARGRALPVRARRAGAAAGGHGARAGAACGRRARTIAELPRAGNRRLRASSRPTGDSRAALASYLDALEAAPSLALEIIPRVLALSSELGDADIVDALTERLQRTGRVSERQLAWLLATALPTLGVQQLPELAGSKPSTAEANALGAMLTRISDSGGRYQCDDCGLHSVGWYWRCPKCRSWDSMRPAVFKWAERSKRSELSAPRVARRETQAPFLHDLQQARPWVAAAASA